MSGEGVGGEGNGYKCLSTRVGSGGLFKKPLIRKGLRGRLYKRRTNYEYLESTRLLHTAFRSKNESISGTIESYVLIIFLPVG